MRAEHIRYFLALAENHSITKTALAFYTTHQSVNKAVRQLEDEMETQLFIRTQRGMQLTRTGELFLPVARNTYEAFQKLRLEIRHLDHCQNLEGTLHLIGTPVSNPVLTRRLIDSFGTLYPKVRYDISEQGTPEIMQYVALHPNALGLVVVMTGEDYRSLYRPYIDQVILYPLLSDEYICLCSERSPLSALKAVSFQEFIQQPIAMLRMDTGGDHPFTELLRKYGQIEPALVTESRQLYAQAIASGHYVGLSSRLLSSRSAVAQANNLQLLPFSDEITLDIMLATNFKPIFNEVSQAFVDLLRDEAARLDKA